MKLHQRIRFDGDPIPDAATITVARKSDKSQLDHAPFRIEVREALGKSLDEAVGRFLAWTWNQRERLEVVHPCIEDAWDEFRSKGFCKT